MNGGLALHVPAHVAIARALKLATRSARVIALPLLVIAVLQCCSYASSVGWGRYVGLCSMLLLFAKPLMAARIVRSFARASASAVAPESAWADVLSVAVTVGWPIALVNGVFFGLLYVTTDPVAYRAVATIAWIVGSGAWIFAVWAFTLHVVDGVALDAATLAARRQLFRRRLASASIFAALVSLPRMFAVSVAPQIAAPDSATPAAGLAVLAAVLWLGDAFAYALAFISRPGVRLDPAPPAEATV